MICGADHRGCCARWWIIEALTLFIFIFCITAVIGENPNAVSLDSPVAHQISFLSHSDIATT